MNFDAEATWEKIRAELTERNSGAYPELIALLNMPSGRFSIEDIDSIRRLKEHYIIQGCFTNEAAAAVYNLYVKFSPKEKITPAGMPDVILASETQDIRTE